MSVINIESSNIKVFPSSKRNDQYDRNARLNSEQNLISLVNRLTNVDSFVINGLKITEDGNNINLSKGSCNIHGYLFEILDDITLTNLDSVQGDKKYLCLEIEVNINSAAGVDFIELAGADISVGSYYNGLNIKVDNLDSVPNTFKLVLAEYKDNHWVADDNRLLKYLVSDIQVNFNEVNYPNTFNGKQNLESWLLNNYVIDDGEL